jgi:hypothetical protein
MGVASHLMRELTGMHGAKLSCVVAIQIKRLTDALRDNDPIRAVIRSSCINSDGRTAGLTLPSSQSHEALIRRSHALAGISDFSQTAMIECHGTGTLVGDPLEATAVGNVFGEHGIYIGSVSVTLLRIAGDGILADELGQTQLGSLRRRVWGNKHHQNGPGAGKELDSSEH